jgi:hypothetical protein
MLHCTVKSQLNELMYHRPMTPGKGGQKPVLATLPLSPWSVMLLQLLSIAICFFALGLE